MTLSRKTRDAIIVALAVASGIIVLAPSLVVMALSLLALVGGFF